MCSTRCGASGTSGPRRRGAQWAEIDLPAGVWTIPAVRMKSKREHRVPLCGRAAEILEAALAHVVANRTEAAYARSDLFERRRRLMDEWAAYLNATRAEERPPLSEPC